jgi:hypothetical protein
MRFWETAVNGRHALMVGVARAAYEISSIDLQMLTVSVIESRNADLGRTSIRTRLVV